MGMSDKDEEAMSSLEQKDENGRRREKLKGIEIYERRVWTRIVYIEENWEVEW